MRRRALSTAVILLLATSAALASAPPSVWFQDDFENWGINARLRNCGPTWGDPTVIDQGTTFAGTTDVNVKNHYPDCDDAGANYVNFQAWQGNSSGGLKGAAAQTGTPAGSTTHWASRSDGNVQILYFKAHRSGDYRFCIIPPKWHFGAYLIDANNQVMMGWQGGGHGMYPQVHLPAVGQTLYPEGVLFPFTEGSGGPPCSQGDIACHEFTAVYHPDTGLVEFFVDANVAPLWTTTIAAGRVSDGVYVRDYITWSNDDYRDEICLDDLAVGTTARPVVTDPMGGSFKPTATPTVTWSHAFASPLPTGYRVKVCASDSPSASPVADGDSGVISGSATSWTTGTLPTNQQLWAFVNEQYVDTWTDWSLQGNGGFYCVTSAPTTPTVTSPSGMFVGAKPAVVFSDGVFHNQFEVKITTTSDGSGTPVWDLVMPNSMRNGASCAVMLTPGTQYFAFAKAGNPVGSSAWSAASPFTVTRIGEVIDFRGMDETWGSQTVYDHEANAPDDGFATEINLMNWSNVKWQVLPDPFNSDGRNPTLAPADWWPSDCSGALRDCPGAYVIPPIPPRTAPSYVYDFWDVGGDINSQSMKRHRVLGVSLDKGVTFTTYAKSRCYEGENCGAFSNARSTTEMAQFYIVDDYGTGKCMAAFRYAQGEIGICTNGVDWSGGWAPGDHYGWHLVRITGRNQVAGDPTTALWKYYIDEDPDPILTQAGSIPQASAPYGGGWMTDCIAVGQGCGGLVGNWQYDWTAINTDGDYAPGEWSGGGTFATISEAMAARAAGPCTITGPVVITGVNRSPAGGQLGFSVQDVGAQDHAGLYIPSTSTTNILVGNKVHTLRGVMAQQTGPGATLQSASFTATTDTAAALPLAMPQKSLFGYRTTPTAGLQNAGMYVRICGRVTAAVPSQGAYAVYIDDGSGLVDGRSVGGNPSALGLRIQMDLMFDGPGAIGNYYRVDGICTCETWTEGATTKTVETLWAPRLTPVTEP